MKKPQLPRIRKNVSLAKYTTFKIGGRTKYFLEARTKDDLIKAIKTAKNLKLPFFIFAGGSNILVQDEGFKGLAIRIQNSEYRIQNTEIVTGAGARLNDLVKIAEKSSLTGLEWAAGIPGTIGGAIYGNAQAFGIKISDVVENAEVFDFLSLRIKNFSKKDCKFTLKNSIFKKNKNLVILSAILKLKKGDKKDINKRIKEFLEYRKERHPKLPSAGSVFINLEIKIKDKKLLEKFPELSEFNKRGIIPSGYLIEKCGLKGKTIGGAQISPKHANFIINLDGAKAKDVLALIKIIKKEVKKKFGINLEEEIQIIK